MIPTIWAAKGALMRLSCPLFYKRIGPGARFTGRIRLPLPFRNVELGRDCLVGHDVFFQTGRHSSIRIGDGTSINTGCHIVAAEAVTIGRDVALGEYITIRDQDHLFAPETGVKGRGFFVAPVAIGDRCWIGRGVHVGPGVRIGSGCIVAANSVVRDSFPDNTLIAGAPAIAKRRIAPGGQTLPLEATVGDEADASRGVA